jgi:hypothetical protein
LSITVDKNKERAMLISIWNPKEEFLINPDTIVYTMIYHSPDAGDLWCDICWTEEQELKTHFWYGLYNRLNKLSYYNMRFGKYVKIHFQEIHGMNPFWDIGRMEFLTKYSEKHGFSLLLYN